MHKTPRLAQACCVKNALSHEWAFFSKAQPKSDLISQSARPKKKSAMTALFQHNYFKDLLLRYSIARGLEDLTQNVPTHLLGLLNAVQMKDRGRDVVHAGFEAHQPKIVFDPRTH